MDEQTIRSSGRVDRRYLYTRAELQKNSFLSYHHHHADCMRRLALDSTLLFLLFRHSLSSTPGLKWNFWLWPTSSNFALAINKSQLIWLKSAHHWPVGWWMFWKQVDSCLFIREKVRWKVFLQPKIKRKNLSCWNKDLDQVESSPEVASQILEKAFESLRKPISDHVFRCPHSMVQVLLADLFQLGHPALLFELDHLFLGLNNTEKSWSVWNIILGLKDTNLPASETLM